MKRLLISVAFVSIFIVLYGILKYGDFLKRPQTSSSAVPQAQTTNQKTLDDVPKISVLATGLEIPWSLVFLPDGSAIFTERPGRVRFVNRNGNLQSDPILTIDEVKHFGEGGLLGVEIHPEFSDNNYVYFYYTFSTDGENTKNRVARYKFTDGEFNDSKVIVDNIPGARFHNGGRIKFGPDGFLYITTGDSQEPSFAQDTNSMAGKILRVTDEGQAATENPFTGAQSALVYSYGHRNPQGLTWDASGRLWESEHGDSTMDELNVIEPGQNYGWPTIRGDQFRDGMESPKIQSSGDTWAPSGAAFLKGSVYFAGLRSRSLFRVNVGSNNLKLERFLNNEFGRIRDVVVKDDLLYILTNNRDGRGQSADGDDKILVVNPSKL